LETGALPIELRAKKPPASRVQLPAFSLEAFQLATLLAGGWQLEARSPPALRQRCSSQICSVPVYPSLHIPESGIGKGNRGYHLGPWRSCFPTVMAESKPSSPADLASTTDLLRRAREGDAQAVDDLFRRHLGPLRRWARGRLPRWTRDLRDTEDLVQETLAQTLKHIHAFEPRHDGALQLMRRR
jgi:hypothetical protein